MVDPREIIRFADEIARRFKPRKIILFGSYAYGTPEWDSDVDLLVIKPYRGPSYKAAARLCDHIDRSFPLDLIVRSPAELTRRISMNDWFMVEIMDKGIVLYDAQNRRVGREGRRRLQRRVGAASITKTASV
jgi:predicted nucleotidyltransferase